MFFSSLLLLLLVSLSALKKRRIESTEVETVTKIVELILKMEDDPNHYADPSKVFDIPFPFIGIIPDRFSLKYGTFSYMGRENFIKLWVDISSLQVGVDFLSTEAKPIFKDATLYGTLGYGKSHMLATLVSLLIRRGRKVVYIPDCKKFLENPFQYLRFSLLMAFLQDKETLVMVLNSETLKDLELICISVERNSLVFIVDQFNAIEVNNEYPAKNDLEKLACQHCLSSAAFQHCILRASSANNTTATRDSHKQRSELDIKWFGGLSDNEWNEWSRRFSTFLSFINDEEVRRMRFGTGQVLLFLKSFMSPENQGNFEKAWTGFISQQEVRDMSEHLIVFSQKVLAMSQKMIESPLHISMLKGCLMGYVNVQFKEFYDHRYMFVSDTLEAGCICGVASEIVAKILMEADSGLFLKDDWVQRCEVVTNPIVKGFMAEKTILSAIRMQGFHLPDNNIQVSSHIVFPTGREAECLKKDENVLYIPEAFNYKAIDSIVRFFPASNTKMLAIAFQVFNSVRHKDSPTMFFPSCEIWEKKSSGRDVEWHFCWISPKKGASVMREERVRTLRGQTLKLNPAYHEHYFSFGDIYLPLSFLDSISY